MLFNTYYIAIVLVHNVPHVVPLKVVPRTVSEVKLL